MTRQTFEFDFDPRFRPLLAGLGIWPGNSRVTLDEDTFEARFGPFRLRTPVSNLMDVQVTRDYRWYKAIGPRASMADRGATFGSTTRGGVCVCFHRPVPALPGMRHPGLTVTVADLEGLAEAVRSRLPSG